jgi:hypothetical protein
MARLIDIIDGKIDPEKTVSFGGRVTAGRVTLGYPCDHFGFEAASIKVEDNLEPEMESIHGELRSDARLG